jgi:hypothetical protein
LLSIAIYENNRGTSCHLHRKEALHVLPLSPDSRWNVERSAVEFGIGVGEYEGVVRIPRRVFQRLLDQSPTPDRCPEAYHLHRTRLERIAERKVRRRQLTDDANVEITGRDLREGERRAPASQTAFEWGAR